MYERLNKKRNRRIVRNKNEVIRYIIVCTETENNGTVCIFLVEAIPFLFYFRENFQKLFQISPGYLMEMQEIEYISIF